MLLILLGRKKMATKWTDSQEEVLKSKNQDILVAAAAGSGKTAVMVEKIIKLITDKENPVDIDTILAVTFTKAAAGEMKERILNKLTEMYMENPEDEHIYKQMSFVNNAKIMTIDGFCSWVVREFYNLTDLDPMFRIGDEAECKLLKSDTCMEMLDDVFEELEQEKDNDIENFLMYYTSAKKTEQLEGIILKLFGYSRAYVNPNKWLMSCLDLYNVNTVEEFLESRTVKEAEKYVKDDLSQVVRCLEKAVNLVMSDETLDDSYGDTIRGYLKEAKELLLKDFKDIYESVKSIKYKDGAKPKSDDKEIWSKAKKCRDDASDIMEKIQKKYFFQSIDDMYKDMLSAGVNAKILIDLCIRFADKYSEVKRNNNICDFDDISHRALDILVKYNEESKSYEKTDAAIDLSKRFSYCLIDEYQDSNEVQEILLSSVSHGKGRYNRIMVGDVKQSIYGFRNSNPKIFMEKYDTFSEDKDANERRIFLDYNFRSRKEILDSVNFIFKQVMVREVGEVDYDEKNYLRYHADYKESLSPGINETEFLVLCDEENSMERAACESYMIASRIKSLLDSKNGFKVYDNKSEKYRDCKKSDIAILTRSRKYDEMLINTLANMDIDAYSSSSKGYFSSEEVQLMLDILAVIDNPRVDIPLTAVMLSKLYQFTEEELSLIKIEFNQVALHENVFEYAENGSRMGLRHKVNRFLKDMNRFRERANYISIYELINLILEETGFGLLIAGMPAGRTRIKNIDMLKEMALNYEESSYKGLFNFIRYIEKQKEYEIDNDGATDVNENDDAVRIMTIHKSKGLQFPVVILFDSNHQYNDTDLKANVNLDRSLGLGLESIDNNLKIKTKTLLKNVISEKGDRDLKGEELRLLYVALTRACEKLIISGSVKKEEEFSKTINDTLDEESVSITPGIICKANSYFKVMSYALARHRNLKNVLDDYYVNIANPMYLESRDVNIHIYLGNASRDGEKVIIDMGEKVSPKDFDMEESPDGRYQIVGYEIAKDNNNIADFEDDDYILEDVKEQLDSNFNYEYPYDEQTKRRSKISVSEAKRILNVFEDEDEDEFIKPKRVYPIIPEFMKNEEEKEESGAGFGSAIHRFFELFDYSYEFEDDDEKNKDMLRKMADTFKENDLVDEETYNYFNEDIFLRFIKTDLYNRMKNASINGKLKREEKFIMTMPASDLWKDKEDDEPVLIQGIIDAYFTEGDKVILVDYKSDHVNSLEELEDRYKVQLRIYKKTLQKVYKKDVEAFIYSMRYGKCVEV